MLWITPVIFPYLYCWDSMYSILIWSVCVQILSFLMVTESKTRQSEQQVMLTAYSPGFLFFYNLHSFFGALILPCCTFSVQLFSSVNLWICSAALSNPQEPWWPQEALFARSFFFYLSNIDYSSYGAENQHLPFGLSLNRLNCLTTCLWNLLAALQPWWDVSSQCNAVLRNSHSQIFATSVRNFL